MRLTNRESPDFSRGECQISVRAMFKPTSHLLMAYVLCMNCRRISVEGMFCAFCPLSTIGANSKQEFNDGVYLGEVEGENSPFLLPINPYFGFHFAFYEVTGTSKTRAAMNLAIKAEKEGLCPRILDIEGEWTFRFKLLPTSNSLLKVFLKYVYSSLDRKVKYLCLALLKLDLTIIMVGIFSKQHHYLLFSTLVNL